jgi:hypothetical protein
MGIDDETGAAALGDQPFSRIKKPVLQPVDLADEAAGQLEPGIKQDPPILRQCLP